MKYFVGIYFSVLVTLLLQLWHENWNVILEIFHGRCCYHHPRMSLRILYTFLWPIMSLFPFFSLLYYILDTEIYIYKRKFSKAKQLIS